MFLYLTCWQLILLWKIWLNDEDVALFALLLCSNTNLNSQTLYKNRITEECKIKLQKAIFDLLILNSVADSHHTCILVSQNGFMSLGGCYFRHYQYYC